MLPSTHAIAEPHARATQPVMYASVSSKSLEPLPSTFCLLYTSSTYRGRALADRGPRMRTPTEQRLSQWNFARVSMSM